ncbi:MAG: hypothetical protein E5Y63_18335 [Mesorhizobium sp.]|uniref:hypothetical protein n=1 Tax=Mesorhizobium sp. TaxID=1871066 RepID=UPI001203C836|nr:hypothetical protein [Mesorhizobium sp.]TIM28856.1 MAG: hypothetical protein E5Y63_18335 [Mesorhizobium sp.]TIO21294.1 MAG: hypothetical protein E5X83_30290 [Mesorhizobium sp.]
MAGRSIGSASNIFQPIRLKPGAAPQDRLPKELVLAGRADIQAANGFIAQTYLPAHNARFARPAAVEDSAFVAADPQQLAQILCIEEERVVARDNTVAFERLRLQLPHSPIRHHFVKATVKIRQYRTAPSRSSTGRAALRDTGLTAAQSKKLAPSGKPREPLRRKTEADK